MNRLKTMLACGVFGAGLAFALPALAQPRDFDVPAMPASRAIHAFAQQAGVNVIASGDTLRGVTTNPVRGRAEVQDALNQMFRGTNMRVTRSDANTYILKFSRQPQPISYAADGAASAPAPSASVAQVAPVAAEADAGLEEIIVTAQKREESLQKTPISIAAFTAADLEKASITEISDLRSQVPSFQITPHPNSGITTRIFMRGVGNNDDQITQDPSVAVYVDGVYVARTQGMVNEVAELERVEVLRGPQGSLYGRNATGGAINFITRAPQLNEWRIKQTVTVGNYSHLRSRTNINVPIGDTLALDAGYMYLKRDGYVKNRGTGVERFGDQRREAWRAALLWQPSDSVSLRYSYDRSQLDDTPVFMAPVPLYPGVGVRPTEGSPLVNDLRKNDALAQGHNLTATWELSDALTIKSISGYRKLDSWTNQNYLAGVLGQFAALETTNQVNQKQFSQEVQAIGEIGDRLQYIFGLYYFDEKGDGLDDTYQPPRRQRTLRTLHIENEAFAVYGQATYTPPILDDRLRLTAGLRWSRDKRQASIQETSITPAATVVGPTTPASTSFDNVSPTLIAAFDVSRDINIYGKVVRGYKSGGFNTRASTRARFSAGFRPETLTSYEVGMKSMLLDNRLRFNIAGFISDYRDIQVNTRSDPNNVGITDVLNAGEARVKGIELDLTARPVRGLTLSASYSYLTGKYLRVIDVTGEDRSDFFRFINMAPHTVSAKAEYQFPPTSFGQLSANVDYYHQGLITTSTSDPRYKVAGYGLLDARLTLADIPLGGGEWRVSAFGRNLTDKEYYISHFNTGAPSAFFGQPRTYGLEISLEY